jgi:hypothetical protein
MEDIQTSSKMHYCGICKTKPDQLSHHKAHLKTQKHLFKKKCFEQCIKMSVLHLFTCTNEEIISMFESETGLKYSESKGEKVRLWRIELMSKLNDLLDQEFPNTIIPSDGIPRENFSTKEDFINDRLNRIIKANETITMNANKDKSDKIVKNIESDKYKSLKEKIQNSTIDELILKAIKTKNEFDIAVILYKINIDKYSLKDFRSNLWINKNDTTIPTIEVASEIRNQLSTLIIDIFTNYCNNLNEDSVEEKNICLQINTMLKRTTFKNNIMKEAKELFYNN